MRVFISHSSKDKPAVRKLAEALEAAGHEPWFDEWEMGPGDSIPGRINAGLDEADAGIIVFSAHTRESRWVEAEADYLIYARIQEGKILVPVVLGEDAYLPPLVRCQIRIPIENIETIVGALSSRKARPAGPLVAPEQGRTERVLVSLERVGDGGVRVSVRIGDQPPVESEPKPLPLELVSARNQFLQGFRTGVRGPAEATRAMLEQQVVTLGRALGRFCLPEGAGEAVSNLLQATQVGHTVEVLFEAADSELLGLPFEALRLLDDRLLAVQPSVLVLRRPAGLAHQSFQPLAGPLKILVAVGAPDEDKSDAVVLDLERELQTILDAVEETRRLENVEVRILEVGSPAAIAEALERDAYHVLHLSCHGGPGALTLEDEDGNPLVIAPEDLLKPVKKEGRPLPLAFLNCCHGGVEKQQTASFAEALLEAGVPAVVAMQTSVSDRYATELAGSFYRHLARREPVLAGRALAAARQELEEARRQRVEQGGALGETQPEYATATLFVAGAEPVLADFSADKVPLLSRPVHELAGPVPQLRRDELIGRRKELRETLRVLRDPARPFAGVVLTGLGGVGKSAVAGRAMRRLVESGFAVVPHVGKLELGKIATALGVAIISVGGGAKNLERAKELSDPTLPDQLRLPLIGKALAEESIVLVLDDFEQNLTTGGDAFLDAQIAENLASLAKNARTGRLLVTCRHPIPGTEGYLHGVSIGPLSLAESRKLLLRLPALSRRAPAELAAVLRVLGGHPRMLEFLDGLLRGGKGRLGLVTEKLQQVLSKANVSLDGPVADLKEALQQSLQLGARDVLLEELLTIIRAEGIEEALLQMAVSNLQVSPEGLARVLKVDLADPESINPTDAEVEAAAAALARLEALSLVFRSPDGAGWVHRWTAEGLAKLSEASEHLTRCNRAGRYRWWQVGNETHDLRAAVEALRNHLAGRDFDTATAVASACFNALTRFQQSVQLSALAHEVRESLPVEHASYAAVADAEASAYLQLGLTEQATRIYEGLLEAHRHRAASEPDRADWQRDLSVSYNRMGDLYRALGQGEKARDAYQRALDIVERLAASEPDRADYQRDLSVSYHNMGDLYRALGQGEKARDAYQRALDIVERLAASEPDRADYQRDLSVSYERMGDEYQALGQGAKARDAYQSSLDIAKRLAASEPDRADYQRDLSVSYNKTGDRYQALGQGNQARDAYQSSLAIRERLAASEPDRADYQRDLSVSYSRMGDLYRALGQGAKARDAYQSSLDIAKRLAASEPDRADYQIDLVNASVRVGDPVSNRAPLERALTILRHLNAEGRLAPADQPKIAALEQMLSHGIVATSE